MKPKKQGKHPANKTEGDKQKQAIQRQIAFASGLFQKDITIRTLLESLSEGVIVVDQRGTILLANARAEQMFGYRNHVHEIIGKHHDILVPMRYKGGHQKHMSNYFEAPRARPLGIGLDLFGLRRDGTEFPVEISLSFVKTANGILVMSFISDISMRKGAEQALQQRAGELEAAVKELEAFSYSVTHDLRNPLQVIVGLGRIIEEDFSDQFDDNAKNLVRRIIDNGKKMDKLIDDILNLSKASRKEMAVGEFDLSKVAAAIIFDLRKLQPDRRIETKVQQACKIQADEGLMRIAMTNLIGNAWKFTQKTKKPRIEFGCIRKNGDRIFFVRDNGAGFDPRQVDKLFIPFSRLHTEKEYSGTGIGLATVARIIGRLGGKIWAEAFPGKGATFYFTVGNRTDKPA